MSMRGDEGGSSSHPHQNSATVRALATDHCLLKQRLLPACLWPLHAEMLVRQMCRNPSARRAVEKPNLDEERFVDLFYRIGLFGERRGQRVHAHRASLVLLDDGEQQLAVNFVEAMAID